ncbi:uncharacterized protein B0H18DRAFT_879334 [Fomitopsis serialis]|uniref:uncharacterized protein n=1 Tax=Fomitopsis serialis TaxID=139415 RepID=UPI0020087736|nr:uncharacterized protein B0H18DRAFT_879334 [Neoantrodia serialis]KAH9922461.1 hypothetical protein B0H18DRAFT_879334 [Neoantrodia serialis]
MSSSPCWATCPGRAGRPHACVCQTCFLRLTLVRRGILNRGRCDLSFARSRVLITRNLSSCVIIIRLQMAGDVLILTSAAVFAAMRIYALFHQNRTLLVLILVLGLVNPVISMYTFINSTPILFHVTPTYQTCSIDTPYISNLMHSDLAVVGAYCKQGMLGARVSSVVSDSLVLILTWKGTRNVAISHGLKKTLMTDSTCHLRQLKLGAYS